MRIIKENPKTTIVTILSLIAAIIAAVLKILQQW